MNSRKIAEFDRQQIAAEEYTKYQVNEKVIITNFVDEEYMVGTVREVISDSTGLNGGYVIEEPDGNITLLFQGSKGPGEASSKADWLDHDF
ncbi:hypothetical protein MKL26_04840 [Streptococcus suis]|nr:hypothetical protein [Streptococcus suis]